ncbi:MAG: SpoIIE family protein phosphatase [Spirochaetales bacterium]|nr:SpoIIE family protein phosphatase [Spirochaetales bacterium]
MSKRLFSHLSDSDFIRSVKRNMVLPDLVQKEDQALHLSTEQVSDRIEAAILSLKGYIDNSNSGKFLEQVLALLEHGVRLLVFDCSKFNFISGTGIGAFAKIKNRLSKAGGELGILSLSDPIREVFRLLGIEGFFTFFSERKEAHRWLKDFSLPNTTGDPDAFPLINGSMKHFSRLQLELLPLEQDRSGAAIPEIQTKTENIEICGFFRPSPQFSGDYFQYQRLGLLFLIIKCDISGHTPETAHVMTKTAALFNQTINQVRDLPGHLQTDIDRYPLILTDFMERLNSSLAVPDLSSQFAALQVMLVDSATGSCLAVNSGDNRVPILRNSGVMEYVELTSNPSSGLFSTDLIRAKGGFVVDRFNLKPGDILFLLTDGLEESGRYVRDETGCKLETEEGYLMTETFGTARISDIIEASFSGNSYKLEREQTKDYIIDFSQQGQTLRSAVNGLAVCEFLFRSYPGTGRVLTDNPTDILLKEYFAGYSSLLEREKNQLEDGIIYQNLGMDVQKEDLTILAIRRKF